MNTDHSIPPLRDLPSGRLAERKQHLLAELTRERKARYSLPTFLFPRLRFVGLASAGEQGQRQSPRLAFPSSRHTRHLLVIGLLAAGILIATPAFGVIGAIRDLFEGTPPTPLVQQHFTKWDELMAKQSAPPTPAPPPTWTVDTRKVHGVLAVHTSDGPLFLWAAPIDDARQCWLLQFANDPDPDNTLYGPSGCDGTIPVDPFRIDWWGDFAQASHPSVRILVGQARGTAASVVAELADHSTLRAQVVESFFVATIPPDAKITKITSYDSNENQLAESTQPNF